MHQVFIKLNQYVTSTAPIKKLTFINFKSTTAPYTIKDEKNGRITNLVYR